MVLLKPTYLISGDVTDIDLSVLKHDGIRGLIFDLDSTLCAPHSGKLTPQVAEWLVYARENFKLAIVSNNKRSKYLEEVKELLNMPIIGKAAKPRRWAFFEVLKSFELNAAEVAVIGDRPLTDVLGGQRAGMKTVLVWPLKTMNEPNWVTMMRKLERIVIRS
jgi:HAD superfamily phosphatase (TIGR01668 family)